MMLFEAAEVPATDGVPAKKRARLGEAAQRSPTEHGQQDSGATTLAESDDVDRGGRGLIRRRPLAPECSEDAEFDPPSSGR
jgi:hypothetical protein